MDPSTLLETFRRDGIVVLDGVLTGAALESFREQVSRELTTPCIPPESGTPEGVRLSDATTWPSGSQRRVIEVVPPGVGAHWGALSTSSALTKTLDVLLGSNAWDLPNNQPHGGKCETRHWYCPVVFPEGSGSDTKTNKNSADWRRGDVGKNDNQWSPQEDAKLHAAKAAGLSWELVAHEVGGGRTPKHCRERYAPPWTAEQDCLLTELCNAHHLSWQVITHKMQHARACTKRQVRERCGALQKAKASKVRDGEQDADTASTTTKNDPAETTKPDASTLWHPVNRRRVRNKGWHVDIGPGFPVDAPRVLTGDPKQGVVALVLLSDWEPGGGGTAFVKGSHVWVSEFLKSKHPAGVTHQELNQWAIKTVADGVKDGLLPLEYEVAAREDALNYSKNDSNDSEKNKNNRLGVISQITGRSGSVALLHPWLVHCGTTNVLATPRLMANGMVCVKQDAFEKQGGVRVLFGLPKLDPDPFWEGKEVKEKSETEEGASPPAEHDPKRARVGDSPERNAKESEETPETLSSGLSFEDALGVASCAAKACTHANRLQKPDPSLPVVSIIVPAHDAAPWLDECFASVLAQTYCGAIQVSAYDDASGDDTPVVLKAWAEVLSNVGIDVKMSGSRWGGFRVGVASGGENTSRGISAGANPFEVPSTETTHGNEPRIIKPGGIGHGKNKAVSQSTGPVLVFLDADDIMTPTRVAAQVAVLQKNENAIVGGTWVRHPRGSTEHYERWANTLADPTGLWLEQFRETTVQMPTWCMGRLTYDSVGGFDEVDPRLGEGEDLVFFHKHIDRFVEKKHNGAVPKVNQLTEQNTPLRRAGACHETPLLLYRWSPESGTSRVSRQRLLEIRSGAFQRRVLAQKSWRQFIVWGAGRDAKAFVNSLTPQNRGKVVAMLDVDENKCGRSYSNHRWNDSSQGKDSAVPALSIPVVFFSTHAASEKKRMESANEFPPIPIVVCVAKRRKGPGEEGDLERNVGTIPGLEEGESVWYFM